MKKRALLLATLLALVTTGRAEAQIGLYGGLIGVPGESFPTADGRDKAGGASGFTLGASWDFPLGDRLVVQPGVNLVNKGWMDDLDELQFTTVRINYLEVPAHVLFTGGAGGGFFVGAGPALLYGLSGTRTVEFRGNRTETDYSFGNGVGQEGALTLALSATAGYDLGRLVLQVGYNQGLTNQAGDNQDFGNESHVALRIGFRPVSR